MNEKYWLTDRKLTIKQVAADNSTQKKALGLTDDEILRDQEARLEDKDVD